MKKLLCVLLALVMVLGLIACGAQEAPAADAPAAEAPDAPAAEAPAAEEKLKLGFHWLAPQEYQDAVRVGAEAWAAANPDVDVIIQGGTDFTQETANAVLEGIAAQGVKGIATVPADAVGANATYEELVNQGITVLTWGGPSAESNPVTFCLATDTYSCAYNACEWVIKQMGEKGNILNVLEILTDPNTAIRKQAIEDCVANYPDVVIYQTIGDMATVEAANEKISNALSAGASEIDGIICTGSGTSEGLCQVLTEYYASNDKRFVTIGIDTNTFVIESVRNGVLGATVAQNPYAQGYLSLEILRLMYAEGYKAAEGEYMVDTGTVFVTAENVDTFQADIEALTAEIAANLTSKYLTK